MGNVFVHMVHYSKYCSDLLLSFTYSFDGARSNLLFKRSFHFNLQLVDVTWVDWLVDGVRTSNFNFIFFHLYVYMSNCKIYFKLFKSRGVRDPEIQQRTFFSTKIIKPKKNPLKDGSHSHSPQHEFTFVIDII